MDYAKPTVPPYKADTLKSNRSGTHFVVDAKGRWVATATDRAHAELIATALNVLDQTKGDD